MSQNLSDNVGGRGALYTGLENKVVLVTGGTRGIGAEIVRQFAYQGSYVAFLGRNKERAKALLEELRSVQHIPVYAQVDLLVELSTVEGISFVTEYARTATGTSHIDVFVNCAGANDNVGIGAGLAQIMRSLGRNLGQYLHVTSLCWNYLKAAPVESIESVELRGNVINIGSKTGDVGQKGSWGYSASKGGITAFTFTAAREGLPVGIRVNQVNPSEVDGDHYREWADGAFPGKAEATIASIGRGIPLGGRMTTEAEIAYTVLFLASNRLSSATTGQIIRPNGGHPQLNEHGSNPHVAR